MKIALYQVDAFAERLFAGNPAAVCPLDAWLDDATLQAIAAENNLSETAFVVREGGGWRIRWFTPAAEVPLCGHATLAAAYVIARHLDPGLAHVRLQSLSGPLAVAVNGDWLTLDFPARRPRPLAPPPALLAGLGRPPRELLGDDNLLAVYASEDEVRALEPDMAQLAGLDRRYTGVIVSAPGEGGVDFVSRYFAPGVGVDEDPVTGSAHCLLTPYWADRLGRDVLEARQVSRRGGVLRCELRGERVAIGGRVVPYLSGSIVL